MTVAYFKTTNRPSEYQCVAIDPSFLTQNVVRNLSPDRDAVAYPGDLSPGEMPEKHPKSRMGRRRVVEEISWPRPTPICSITLASAPSFESLWLPKAYKPSIIKSVHSKMSFWTCCESIRLNWMSGMFGINVQVRRRPAGTSGIGASSPGDKSPG